MRANGFPSVRASLQGRDAPSEQGKLHRASYLFQPDFWWGHPVSLRTAFGGAGAFASNASDFIRSLEFLHLEQVESLALYQGMALAMAQIRN